MAYTPNIWVDREGTTRYFETTDTDGAKIFTPDYSQLTEIGTPVNADNMNHIEEGIAAGSFTKYDSNTVYQINDLVTSFEGNDLKVYKSLKSENYNNPVIDTTYWEEVALGGGGSGFSLFDTKVSDYVLNGEQAIGWELQGTFVNGAVYPDFYAECVSQKENATATETTLDNNTITMYINANGHQFYDISDKDVVDIFYHSMGVAWFYGIDTENERIFLPRNDYFDQLTGDITQVGKFIEAGLPNITGRAGDNLKNAEGAFYTIADDQGYPASNGSTNSTGFDASRSNPIYGNSDTVQPNAVKKLLYICVGNTVINENLVDVGKVMKEAVLRSSLVEADSHFSGVPMPSNKYIDLTVGASDTQYTAPANGWFVVDSYVSGNYIALANQTIGGMRSMSLKVSNTDMVCYLPVSKGDVITLGYGGNWTPNSWQTKPFRFYYAKGEV